MLRIAAKLSSRASSTAKPFPISCTRISPLSSSSFRSFTIGLELEANMVVPDAIRMINYALKQARTERSLGAYRMGLTVLKHCITTELTEGKDPVRENSKGMALLAMSTLLSERGEYGEAIEKLDGVQDLTNSYLGIRVAAFEAQPGFHLELGKDDLTSVVADRCIDLVEKESQARDHEATSLDGLYRKVIDILKVPPMETKSEEGAASSIDRSDIAAFARDASGAYFRNRKGILKEANIFA
ncbi:uncharacterized protein LOC113862870 [Abrus precatorius]|uniref:Uncharacterized protein LOC113862870 n=1 Tax=Abrus precatorius TaxID=3816 RepID=A0A8B8L6V2_ABRPR|nr:uncharacterized protein LOC113862870 [Abrus precatorius]